MTKISNQDVYIIDTDVSDLDTVIGTDGNTSVNTTKNFLLGKLKQYFVSGLSPLEGGTLRYTEVVYTGNTYATNAAVLNNLDPVFVVEQYHVVVVNLNGIKSILKLQNQTVGIDLPDVLTTDFIDITPSASNVGTGAGVFKELSTNDYKFRKIKTENSGTGNAILKAQLENTNDISIIAKSLLLESQGAGTSLIKDLQSNTDDNKIRLRSIDSESLNVTVTGDVIFIETPAVSDIPALIVNSAYTGTEELGTASKPFKTIQGALNAYQGTGGKGTTALPTSPELLGSIIQIEKGDGVYNFTGDFDYKDLQVSIKEGAVISSTPSGSWLMDFTKFSTTTVHNPSINTEEGGYLFCQKNGFKLVGGDFAVGNSKKTLSISGSAKLTGIVLAGTLEADILFEVNGGGEVYVNGGFPTLQINTFIAITRGRMFVIKGNGSVYCTSTPIYVLTNPTGTTITNTYPPIEIRNSGILNLTKATVQFSKTASVTYNQFVATYDSAILEGIDTIFSGHSEYFAYNNSVANTATVRLDSCKMYMVNNVSFAGTISGIWLNMNLTNNNITNATINNLTTDILPSATNTIGGQLLETLSIYASRSLAVIAGLKKGGAFINRKTVTSGVFVVGLEYKIDTIGTTDFTLIGATANTIGLYFTASGVGTGTGTAFYDTRDTVM
jgi:HKD family nuclease